MHAKIAWEKILEIAILTVENVALRGVKCEPGPGSGAKTSEFKHLSFATCSRIGNKVYFGHVGLANVLRRFCGVFSPHLSASRTTTRGESGS